MQGISPPKLTQPPNPDRPKSSWFNGLHGRQIFRFPRSHHTYKWHPGRLCVRKNQRVRKSPDRGIVRRPTSSR